MTSPYWSEACARNRSTARWRTRSPRWRPPSLKLEIVEIRDLPLFNQDEEATPPRRVGRVQGAHPEGRRRAVRDARIQPFGARRAEERDRRRVAAIWQERVGQASPRGVVSVSPGAIGGFGANHHLRQSLVFLNMPAMQQPEAYIGGADKLFDAQGKLDQRCDAGVPAEVPGRVRGMDRPQRRPMTRTPHPSFASGPSAIGSAPELADDGQRLVDRVRAVARRDRVRDAAVQVVLEELAARAHRAPIARR